MGERDVHVLQWEIILRELLQTQNVGILRRILDPGAFADEASTNLQGITQRRLAFYFAISVNRLRAVGYHTAANSSSVIADASQHLILSCNHQLKYHTIKNALARSFHSYVVASIQERLASGGRH